MKTNERHNEPAFIEQETVHIAELISEIHPDIRDEHKDHDPKFAGKIVFMDTNGKSIKRLKINSDLFCFINITAYI